MRQGAGKNDAILQEFRNPRGYAKRHVDENMFYDARTSSRMLSKETRSFLMVSGVKSGVLASSFILYSSRAYREEDLVCVSLPDMVEFV